MIWCVFMTDSPKDGKLDPKAFAESVGNIDKALKEGDKKNRVSVLLGSYHFKSDGQHNTREVNGAQKHFNEFNPGLILARQTSENVEPFMMVYKNSHDDLTATGGFNYTPLKAQIGNFRGDFGTSAGIAWTKNGSYAKEMPKLSKGNFTALATLYGSVEHIPTGTGVQLNAVPPVGKDSSGVVSVSITKRF